MPLVGGAPKKLLTQLDSAVTFSPDGKQLAFVRYISESEDQLVLTDPDGSGERVLVKHTTHGFFQHTGLVKISWSPDGETIVCPTFDRELAYGSAAGLVEVRVRDGTERPFTPRKWAAVTQVAWLRDGGGLVLIAQDKPPSGSQVWHLSYPDGEARKITNDFSDYGDISVTAASSATYSSPLTRRYR